LQKTSISERRAGARHVEPFAGTGVTDSSHGEHGNSIDYRGVMKKFNNTLAGTDCGDAGLPAHTRDTARAKTVLRLVPKPPDIEPASGSVGWVELFARPNASRTIALCAKPNGSRTIAPLSPKLLDCVSAPHHSKGAR